MVTVSVNTLICVGPAYTRDIPLTIQYIFFYMLYYLITMYSIVFLGASTNGLEALWWGATTGARTFA